MLGRVENKKNLLTPRNWGGIWCFSWSDVEVEVADRRNNADLQSLGHLAIVDLPGQALHICSEEASSLGEPSAMIQSRPLRSTGVGGQFFHSF